MTEINSTSAPAHRKAPKQEKPKKPYPNFPLFPHATRRWAKKIRQEMHYFGSWADGWEAALKLYQEQRDDLHAGRKPRKASDGSTIMDLLNRFLEFKKIMVGSGELSPRTYADYNRTADLISDAFGCQRQVSDLGSDDFEKFRESLAKTRGPVALGNEIQRIRVFFKYAYDASLIEKPIRYGPGFKRPSKKTLRLHRAAGGICMFTAGEIRRLMAAASVQVRAMILLGINCGFGNADVGMLPMAALDLKEGWVNHPRPKTGINRRCPLWPETLEAIKEALEERPTPKHEAHAGLLFITKYGAGWFKDDDRTLSKKMAKLLRELSINGRRRLNFYALRHTFRTVADETRDQPAIDFIMGHARNDMADAYRERIGDDRLQAVVDHVRVWLFGEEKKVNAKLGSKKSKK